MQCRHTQPCTAAVHQKLMPSCKTPYIYSATSQVRAEFLDITLAVLCLLAPEIESRLRQVGPGRGRAGAGQVDGAAQLFALAEGLPDAVKKVGGCLLCRGEKGSKRPGLGFSPGSGTLAAPLRSATACCGVLLAGTVKQCKYACMRVCDAPFVRSSGLRVWLRGHHCCLSVGVAARPLLGYMHACRRGIIS